MMKKILFAIASILVGIMLVMFSTNSAFYNQVVKECSTAVENKDYEHTQRFLAYAMDKDAFYKGDQTDGTHIEIFSSLIIDTASTYDDEGNATKTVNVLKECIQVSLFHLPSTFALADKAVAEGEEAIKGGVSLVLDDSSEVLFPFNDGVIDFYGYVQYYNLLPLFITYDNYQEKVGTKEVVSVKILDGNGNLSYEVAPTTKLSMDTQFNKDFHELTQQYQELYLKYDETAEDAKEQAEAINEVFTSIDTIASSDKYIKQHSTDLIYKSSGYIWSIVLTVVIFLAIDGVLGFLLFRKKKAPAYMPKRPLNYNNLNKNQTVTRTPEQFSRKDVFDAEEGSFVIEDNKPTEVPAEVVEEQTEESEKVE